MGPTPLQGDHTYYVGELHQIPNRNLSNPWLVAIGQTLGMNQEPWFLDWLQHQPLVQVTEGSVNGSEKSVVEFISSGWHPLQMQSA